MSAPWTIEPMDVERDLEGVLAVESECFVNPWTREMYVRELQHPNVARVFVLRTPEEPVKRDSPRRVFWLILWGAMGALVGAGVALARRPRS